MTTSGTIVGSAANGALPLDFQGYGGTGLINTLYIWGTWGGATIKLQCRPSLTNANGTPQWFNMPKDDGTYTWSDPGSGQVDPFNFIGRSAGYQFLISGATSATALLWEIR